MEQKLAELQARLAEIKDLVSAASVLHWDQNVYMPPGGAQARGRQIATLAHLAHEKLVDPQVGRLLDELQPYAESLPYDSDAASLVRVACRLYEEKSRVPPQFTAEFYDHTAATLEAWKKARPADDFAKVQPYLEKTLDLSRQYASYFDYDHIADPLIGRPTQDPGMTVAIIRPLFAELRGQLVPLVQAITEQPRADDACLHQFFPERQQLDFGVEVIKRFGYDFERGRQDEAPHPFTIEFSIGDVRITTRVDEHYLGSALFSTLHEAGHAMYEQGSRPDFEGTPLAGGTSMGVHESQSRLWENLVGRSRGFWRHFYPRLQAVFPDQLADVTLEAFYRAINKVEPSLLRVEADEVTYNLHVMLRFDFECQLLEGSLAVRDLPEAWRARMEADLGIAPPNDHDGVLQDIHWYMDTIGGMFQCYTLGNIMSAQFFDAALHAHPEIESEMENGEFGTLHRWLIDNVYQHGTKFTAPELLERVIGGPMRIEPYIRYLREKYGELYALNRS
jgi:carboxypeptidase Taq